MSAPTIKEIQQRTSAATGVPLSDIMSYRRDGRTARARQIAMYAARLLTPFSLPQIGQAFNRDHTTVLYTVRRIESRVYGEPDLVAVIRKVCTSGDWRRA